MKFLLRFIIFAWLSLLTFAMVMSVLELVTIEQVLKVTVMKVFPQKSFEVQ